jgi:hypothetical protein
LRAREKGANARSVLDRRERRVRPSNGRERREKGAERVRRREKGAERVRRREKGAERVRRREKGAYDAYGAFGGGNRAFDPRTARSCR